MHAGIADSTMWDAQWASWPALQPWRLVRYDLRGFGQSPIEAGAFSHARDLLSVLDDLEIERTALVAASMGGRAALEVAIAAPERVSALVLAAPGMPLSERSAELKAYGAAEEAAWERGDLDETTEINVRFWLDGVGRPGGQAPAEQREHVRRMQRRALELQQGLDDEEEPLCADFATRLGEVAAPTLVLVGEYDVPDMHAIATRLAAGIPGAQHAPIAGAAHLPALEQPAGFDRVVLPFLAGVLA